MSITTQRQFFFHNGSQILSVCDASKVVATDSFCFMGAINKSNYLEELLSTMPDTEPSEANQKMKLNQINADESSVRDRRTVAARSEYCFVQANLATPITYERVRLNVLIDNSTCKLFAFYRILDQTRILKVLRVVLGIEVVVMQSLNDENHYWNG